jgi:ferredoxin-thioredoxin reductase catalytic subunit
MTDVVKYYDKLKKETEEGGYLLNPDKEFVFELIEGLLTNEERYGYQSCPCRLAEGTKDADLDIICPCDYRDPDLNEFGACYCALYVTQDWIDGKMPQKSIPERRKRDVHEQTISDQHIGMDIKGLTFPIWRCKVCGYLSAREHPPEVCPICKAKKDRFEIFIKQG